MIQSSNFAIRLDFDYFYCYPARLSDCFPAVVRRLTDGQRSRPIIYQCQSSLVVIQNTLLYHSTVLELIQEHDRQERNNNTCVASAVLLLKYCRFQIYSESLLASLLASASTKESPIFFISRLYVFKREILVLCPPAAVSVRLLSVLMDCLQLCFVLCT